MTMKSEFACSFCGETVLKMKRVRVPQAPGAKPELMLACPDCALAAGVKPMDVRKALGIGRYFTGLQRAVETALNCGMSPDELMDDMRFAFEDRADNLDEKINAEGVNTKMEKEMDARAQELRDAIEILERS